MAATVSATDIPYDGFMPLARSEKIGVYPGSFNPLTWAHLAIAEAAVSAHGLLRIDLAQSHRPLGKDVVERPTFAHRVEVLRAAAAARPWLGVLITDKRLITEIAQGYDMVVMGADKWVQIQDPVWYNNDPVQRDAALAELPPLAVAPRPPHQVPAEVRLTVPPEAITDISSTQARNGDSTLMAPEARRFAEKTGAWIDPNRYEQYLADLGNASHPGTGRPLHE